LAAVEGEVVVERVCRAWGWWWCLLVLCWLPECRREEWAAVVEVEEILEALRGEAAVWPALLAPELRSG
jgi:hypothetical protein